MLTRKRVQSIPLRKEINIKVVFILMILISVIQTDARFQFYVSAIFEDRDNFVSHDQGLLSFIKVIFLHISPPFYTLEANKVKSA